MNKLAALFTAFILSCGGADTAEKPPRNKPKATVEKTTLTVYSGRGESLVGNLFKRIPEDAPFAVEVQYGKTAEMVTRLISEGDQTPADVIFAQDSGHLGALGERGLLAELPQSILDAVDPAFRSEEGQWVGTSGRLRVLVYDTTKVKEADLPKSLEALADPKWKGKLGWAPTNGSLHAHVSALRYVWGEDKTRSWLKAIQANSPTKFPKNSPQVAAANEGAIALGWVNHYYLHRLDKEERTAANWSFPAAGDAGNVLMIAGVGIRKNSPKRAAAEAFVEWLVTEESQHYFAQEGFEYPTRPGIPTHPDVQPLQPGQLATVNQSSLADLGPTRTLLTELGLL